MRKRLNVTSLVLTLAVIFNLFFVLGGSASATTTYNIHGVQLPLAGYENGAPSYGNNACWAFANMIYKKLWGNEPFTYSANSSSDMLKGKKLVQRKITVQNTQNFITAAPVGSVIRVDTHIDGGDDGSGHNMILLDKTSSGATYYDSTNSGIRVYTYTWQEFYNHFNHYGYFKYIKYEHDFEYYLNALFYERPKLGWNCSDYPCVARKNVTSSSAGMSLAGRTQFRVIGELQNNEGLWYILDDTYGKYKCILDQGQFLIWDPIYSDIIIELEKSNISINKGNACPVHGSIRSQRGNITNVKAFLDGNLYTEFAPYTAEVNIGTSTINQNLIGSTLSKGTHQVEIQTSNEYGDWCNEYIVITVN